MSFNPDLAFHMPSSTRDRDPLQPRASTQGTLVFAAFLRHPHLKNSSNTTTAGRVTRPAQRRSLVTQSVASVPARRAAATWTASGVRRPVSPRTRSRLAGQRHVERHDTEVREARWMELVVLKRGGYRCFRYAQGSGCVIFRCRELTA